jgi:SAM-dependent methyltransferase
VDETLKTWPPGPDQAAEQDLGGHREGHPERLDRNEHGETLVEAEHLARYSWIAAGAKGKRVLDAGCGTAYGTESLARAGAAEVTGVDRARAVLEVARPRMPQGVTLQAADLEELPFEDGSFDLVVCFEVLEHLENPEAGLDELARVLAKDGLLAISSPNRDVFPPGNPHHIHEYTPAELGDSLARRFANVRLLRQHAWYTSAILSEEALAAGDKSELEARVSKTSGIAPGAEIFTIGLAGDVALPKLGNELVVGPQIDQRALVEGAAVHAELSERIAELHERTAQLREARQQLTEAEQNLAELPALRGSRIELEAVKSSLSWRLTAPLRRARGPVGRALPPLRIRIKRLLAALIARVRS